ncbi:hypothetical protein AVEN_154478-1 [Araneus ventricosus]|uniref:Uncharacterized protein n=1 Tax=Araneus ventricosus TaxID=182803 RepID=A0A4Y2K515_ARAVE|nr:hypothetical protein AVEN_154478-1 [Araneus ventricosus]
MNSRRFPSPRKPLWELRFTTQTPSLTLARPKIRLARIEPTKPAGAGVVVRVLKLLLKCYVNKNTTDDFKKRAYVSTYRYDPFYVEKNVKFQLMCIPTKIQTFYKFYHEKVIYKILTFANIEIGSKVFDTEYLRRRYFLYI